MRAHLQLPTRNAEDSMSIQNELSSDIAVALLARGGKDPEQLKEMKDLILRIHATLQEKVAEGERTRARAHTASAGRTESKSKVSAN